MVKSLLSERRPPEYVARSVAVGLFVAFTPTVGLQIAMVFMFWGLTRFFARSWAFNPVVASAWTMLTNVFTMAPLYYVFVQTGRVILGRWENIRAYGRYLVRFAASQDTATAPSDGLWSQGVALWAEFGVPLFVGALPWALGISGVGYWWSLRLVQRHRARAKPPAARPVSSSDTPSKSPARR